MKAASMISLLLAAYASLQANDLEEIFGPLPPPTHEDTAHYLDMLSDGLEARAKIIRGLIEVESFTLHTMVRVQENDTAFTYKPMEYQKITSQKEIIELKGTLGHHIENSTLNRILSFSPTHKISCLKNDQLFIEVTIDADRRTISVTSKDGSFARGMLEVDDLLEWFPPIEKEPVDRGKNNENPSRI